MTAFQVTVRLPGQAPAEARTIPAIGTDACAVHMTMIDEFGVCLVSVKPAPAK